MGDVVALPKKRSAKQLARAYMLGELSPHEYSEGGGVLRLMRIADNSRSDIASVQALDKLSRLADLEHENDGNTVMQVKLIAIKNDGNDNAVRIDSA